MENEPSALATLRQLKEWLDAGAITPAEFEVLKRKLLFSDTSEPTAAPVAPPSVLPTPPPAPTDSAPTATTVISSSAPLPPPPPSWDFKHDPTVAIGSVKDQDQVRPPEMAVPPSRVEPAPNPAASIPPVFTPPVVPPVPPVVPPREQSQAPPKKPAPPIDTFTRPVEMVKVGSSSYRDADSLTPEPQVAESRRPRPAIPPPSGRNPLATALIVGGILALLALIGYLVMDDRKSERLTSLSRSGADTVSVAPEVGPQVEQLELPPVTDINSDSDTARVTPALPATPPVATTDSARSASAPAAQVPVITAPTTSAPEITSSATPSTTAPEDSQAAPAEQTPVTSPAPNAKVGEVEAKIRSALSSYYADLKAPPFNAAQHFAPAVERFYTLQNTTPAAISAELDRSHFPEFLEGETQGVPGSLAISEPVRDGSRVVTYLEKSRAFRKSRQQHQNTTAQVRIRFNRDFKIVYLRQERLLENTFSE